MTYLAAAIEVHSPDHVKEQAARAAQLGAEMIELRLDGLPNLSEQAVRDSIRNAKSSELPIIATCRDPKEGGVNSHGPDQRLQTLLWAIEENVEFVDCEYANYKEDIKEQLSTAVKKAGSTRLILSAHQFQGKFNDLQVLYDCILAVEPDAIPKLVYQANHINDCFEAFDVLHDKDGDVIILCMGPAGMISRILAKKLGSLVSYASLETAAETAPGQCTVEQMRSLYRWDRIDTETHLYGIIGDPVGHSMSPRNFNSCFENEGMNRLYLPLHVQGEREDLETFLTEVSQRQWLDFHGFSVTIPHKTASLFYVENHGEYVDPLAGKIGAANTLKLGFGGILTAYNTDYIGALTALTQAMGIDKHDLHQCEVAVVGAGGAARAVITGLADVGAHITIYNRTLKRAQSLADEYKAKAKSLDELGELSADIIINCTSIGMHPNVDASPIPAEVIREGMVVFDTVYTPLETLLLKDAKKAGAKCVSGIEMFVHQALAQYKIFTGQEPGADLEGFMRKTVLEALSE